MVWHGMVRLVAVGTRHIDDDAGVVIPVGPPLAWARDSAGFQAGRVGLEFVFVANGGKGAEEQVAGIGHDGGTARGDAVVSFEKEEPRKETIDVRGGGEFG